MADQRTERTEWFVNCRDAADRDRTVRVRPQGDHVAMVMPAGESAVLTTFGTRQLREALRLAGTPIGGGDHVQP